MNSQWSDLDASVAVQTYGLQWGEPMALRIYSARLLGADASLVLHGGGNTSLKTTTEDLHGEAVETLFVKASGRDLARLAPEDQQALDLARLRRLRALPSLSDAQMRAQIRLARLDPDGATASLETLAHAFLPAKFIDHTHADAVLALTNQERGEALVREAMGEDVIVLSYLHPGFALAKAAADAYEKAPRALGMIWMHHGLLTWGATARESYEAMVELVTRADRHIGRCSRPLASRVGAGAAAPTSPESAARRLTRVAPLVRGCLSPTSPVQDGLSPRAIVLPLVDSAALAFVDAPGAKARALTPPLTTDHLIRTKALPLWLDAPDFEDEERLRRQLAEALAQYASAYTAYLDRHANDLPAGLERAESLPRVLLLPGLGALCVGHDLRSAEIARDITAHTLKVKSWIGAMGGVVSGPSETDLFHMEYRPQQHDKLHTAPRISTSFAHARPLEGRIALVTGAAGAIGSGLCKELLERGALVAATDLAGSALDALVDELSAAHPARIDGIPLDVSRPESVSEGFGSLIRRWGGLDLLVINAGIAHSGPLEALALAEFRHLEEVNVEGTLHLLAEASRLFSRQGIGGDIVLISSKNVFAPGAGFGAYSATKAAAHQLARIASLELAPLDVRVNMVAPDAVFSEGSRASGLWAQVGPDRMRARGLDAAGLEAYYRNRNLLKARISARDVARAVIFFATRQAPITGATLPVDGGLPEATPR